MLGGHVTNYDYIINCITIIILDFCSSFIHCPQATNYLKYFSHDIQAGSAPSHCRARGCVPSHQLLVVSSVGFS